MTSGEIRLTQREHSTFRKYFLISVDHHDSIYQLMAFDINQLGIRIFARSFSLIELLQQANLRIWQIE